MRRRPGGRSAAVTQAVYDATLDLLAEVGYRDLQLPDVAARAGVNKTTVYRRWPTTAQLVGDLIRDLAVDEVPIPDTGTLHGDLVALLTDVAAIIDRPAVKAIIQAGIPQPTDAPPAVAARVEYWQDRFGRSSEIVRRAIARGELDAGTEPRTLVEYASSPIYFRRLVTGEAVDDAFVEQLAARTIRAFGREDRRHGS